MSKKIQKPQASGQGRTVIAAGSVAVLLIALVAATVLYEKGDAQSSQPEALARRAALASDHSPAAGDPDAHMPARRLTLRRSLAGLVDDKAPMQICRRTRRKS